MSKMPPREELILTKKVMRLIVEQLSPLNASPRVYLDLDDYQKFLEEVKPLFKEQYGCFLTHEGASNDGYENILFGGYAVCLKM